MASSAPTAAQIIDDKVPGDPLVLTPGGELDLIGVDRVAAQGVFSRRDITRRADDHGANFSAVILRDRDRIAGQGSLPFCL
jgi:hypothetical protein